jgi:hypothetical protein
MVSRDTSYTARDWRDFMDALIEVLSGRLVPALEHMKAGHIAADFSRGAALLELDDEAIRLTGELADEGTAIRAEHADRARLIGERVAQAGFGNVAGDMGYNQDS